MTMAMARRAVGRPWSTHEDSLLANAVAVHGQVDNWKAVALLVPGRSNKACRKRWLHSLSPNVKKSAWTKEEDNLLLHLYEIHSAKWAIIARNIPGRTDDACSKRYREALDPSLKKDEWTADEDQKLLVAYHRLGGKWGRVGQELQRSGLACRNRWRLLERKRLTASSSTPPKPPPDPFQSTWPSLPMVGFWDPQLGTSPPSPSGVDTFSHDQHLHAVDYSPPFHYPSSLTSALSSQIPCKKDTEPPVPDARQSLVLSSASPSDNTSTPVFAPFDFESSPPACALSVGSTSPAPQPAYTDDNMQQPNPYSDRQHQFHQLQRSLSHTALPAHSSSVRPVQVDHYTASVSHEESAISHAALVPRYQQPPQSSSLHAQNSADPYFASSHLPERQASHMPSSMTSPPLLDNPDAYYHPSPEPGLDVNTQHPLIHPPDPLALSEPRPVYHYAHHRDPSRARVVESVNGRGQHADYYNNHVLPDRTHHVGQPSRPPTSSPPQPRHALQLPDRRNVNTPSQPEAGPSRTTPDHYYTSNPLHPSQLIRRSTASPRPVGVPYQKRPLSDSSSTISEDYQPPPFHPAPKRKFGTAASRKRPDSQAPLRLSSDLQATADPSVKPYACGHENCWPSNAASSRACYCTSRGLSDHNKTVHPEDAGGDRPYRCALEGCGKSWKSINGLQYHLQISKAHFQHAISSSFVSTYVSNLAVPPSVEASGTSTEGEERTKKRYKCPHENCPNRYKQLSGLRYHLAHGHPVDLPRQLDLVPPALSRKLAEKMHIPVASPDCQAPSNGSGVSIRPAQGSFIA